MLKKLFLIIIASVFLMTACESVKGVNLNQMFLNTSNMKSYESRSVFTLDLAYKDSNVKDAEYLKVLHLLDNMKFDVRTKMQSTDTFSMSGFVQVKPGKIPFELYADKKEMVILLDQASKAIRIPTEEADVSTEKFVQNIQTDLLPSVVKSLPNPKTLYVSKNVNFNVNGEKVQGHKIHAEVYANEVPNLLIKFLDNLVKDQKAINQLTRTINDMSKMSGDDTVMTTLDLKQVIKELKVDFNQSLPEMKKSGTFDKRNFLKTDIYVDKKLNARKSTSVISLKKLSEDAGGIDGITLRSTEEVWNINKKVQAKKINRTEFLNEDATEEEFLSTLDKKNSVLYRVIKSFD